MYFPINAISLRKWNHITQLKVILLRKIEKNPFTSRHGIANYSVNVNVVCWENILTLGKKICIGRESNPGRPRGRRAFYHWTTDAPCKPPWYSIYKLRIAFGVFSYLPYVILLPPFWRAKEYTAKITEREIKDAAIGNNATKIFHLFRTRIDSHTDLNSNKTHLFIAISHNHGLVADRFHGQLPGSWSPCMAMDWSSNLSEHKSKLSIAHSVRVSSILTMYLVICKNCMLQTRWFEAVWIENARCHALLQAKGGNWSQSTLLSDIQPLCTSNINMNLFFFSPSSYLVSLSLWIITLCHTLPCFYVFVLSKN